MRNHFYASALSLLALGAAYASTSPEDSEKEYESPIEFTKQVTSSDWCPGKRMMVAMAGRGRVVLRPKDAKNFTVYVDDVIVTKPMFRVTQRSISVCLPVTGSPRVLIFGQDSRGLAVEFSSTYAQEGPGRRDSN